MMRTVVWTVLCFCMAAIQSAGCASVPARPVEFPPKGAPAPQRQATYATYRLRQHGNWFSGYRWNRSDGDYSFGEIDPLLTEFSETRAFQRDNTAQTWTVVGLSVVGGALLGLAVADSLDDKRSFGTSTDTALYISGGVVIGAAFLVSALWQPRELDKVYNAALARQLNLSGVRTAP